jgi:hypothetical protein
VLSRDAAGNLATSGDQTFTTLDDAGSTTEIYLSDMTPVGTPVNGWGPIERDRSNGETGPTDGNTLTINGTTYAKGLGAHAASEISFEVPPGCTTFSVAVGIDDEVASGLGSISFEVWDGTAARLAQSVVKTGSDGPTLLTVPLPGASTLRLVQVAGSSNAYDHGDWADAKFTCSTGASPGDTEAPELSAIAAAPTATSATITWSTDEPSDTQIEYGLTASYGSSTTLDAALATGHSQTLNGLSPNTLYHYRVLSRDLAGNLATSGDQTFTTDAGGPSTIYLSDLPTTGTPVNAWGPFERDRSNGERGAADGRVLTINGTTYARGLGAHAASDIRYLVPAGCTTFTVDVGIDDEVPGSLGSIRFEVWNGTSSRLAQSPTKTGADGATTLTVPLLGVTTLRLVQVAVNGNAYDHGDWADARLSCSS